MDTMENKNNKSVIIPGKDGGDYICVHPDCDYISEDGIKKLSEVAGRTDADIIRCDYNLFYGEGEKRKFTIRKCASDKKHYGKTLDPKDKENSFLYEGAGFGCIYKKSFLEKNGISFDEGHVAGFGYKAFYMYALSCAKSVYLIDEALYFKKLMRADELSDMISEDIRVFSELDNAVKALREKGNTDAIPYVVRSKYLECRENYKLVKGEARSSFLKMYAEDFADHKEKGELVNSVFSPAEWTDLNWIMKDPEGFLNAHPYDEVAVSVVIAFYNAEKYLEETIGSLIYQTLPNIEIILVDDESTDNSEEIINSFIAKDKRVSLVKQKHQNAGAARNLGLKHTRGKYVLFLDADDFFAIDMLEKSYDEIRLSNADICLMGNYQYNNATGEISVCTYSVKADKYPEKWPFNAREMTYNPFKGFVGWAWDKLYLKSFITNNELTFQEQRTTNDMRFTFLSILKAGRITVIEEPLIYQRRNNTGTLSTTREKSWECFLNALTDMKSEIIKMGEFERYENYYLNYAIHSCIWNLNTLSDASAGKLSAYLKEEGFERLGLTDFQKNMAENMNEYEIFDAIRKKGEGALPQIRNPRRRSFKRVITYIPRKAKRLVKKLLK